MKHYIIRFSYGNEIVTEQQLTDIYNKAHQFDGFTGLSLEREITEPQANLLKKALPYLYLSDNAINYNDFAKNKLLQEFYNIYKNQTTRNPNAICMPCIIEALSVLKQLQQQIKDLCIKK